MIIRPFCGPGFRSSGCFLRDLGLAGLAAFFVLSALSPSIVSAQAEADAEAASAESAKPSIQDEAGSILAEIDKLQAQYRDLTNRAQAAEDGGDKAVAELQAHRRLVDWMREIDRLVANLLAQMELGLDTAELLQKTRKLLWRIERRIPTFLDEVMAKNAELRAALAVAPPELLTTAEARLSGSEATLDEAVRFYLTLVENLEKLELGTARAVSSAADRLEKRAGDLSARLQLAGKKVEDTAAMAAQDGSVEKRAVMHDAQEEFDQIATSLWTTCDVMDALGLPTAEHRQVLILATGELTTDILDTDVLSGLVGDAVENTRRWFEHRGPALVGRVAIFISILAVFWVLAGVMRRLVPRLVASSGEQLSELAGRVIVGLTSRLVLAVGVIVALSQVGVDVTTLLAGLGIAGFVIGFALQETLGNFAAGTMILIYRPFDVGDVIEAAGVLGTVDHMNLVSTRILTFDNQTMIVPNTRVWGDVIRNTTALERRRVDLSFPLALDVDAQAAEEVFASVCREHPAVLSDPPPAIKVQKVSGSGVLYVVRPWVKTEDYWETYWELNREAYVRLREAGIRIERPRYELESQTDERQRLE